VLLLFDMVFPGLWQLEVGEERDLRGFFTGCLILVIMRRHLAKLYIRRASGCA